MGEAVGNDNVCVCIAISLWQGHSILGEDWGYKTSASMLRWSIVPDDPPQTTGSHLCCGQVHTVRKLTMTALYTFHVLFKEIFEKEYKRKGKGKIHQNSRDVHLNCSIIGLQTHTTGPVIHFHDLYSVFFNYGHCKGILLLIWAHWYHSQMGFKLDWVKFYFLQRMYTMLNSFIKLFKRIYNHRHYRCAFLHDHHHHHHDFSLHI